MKLDICKCITASWAAWSFTLAGCGYAPDMSRRPPSEFALAPAKPAETQATVAADVQPEAEPTSHLQDSGGRPWIEVAKLPYEYWEVLYLERKRIGFSHVLVEPSKSMGAAKLRISRRSVLEVARAGQRVRQELVVESIEDADGSLRTLTETQRAGKQHTETSGSVFNGKLKLTERDLAQPTNPQKSIAEIATPDGVWGPMGIQQILLRRPMQPKDRYAAVVFVELLHQFAKVELLAGQWEDTPVGTDSLAKLLPIDVTLQAGSNMLKTRNWINVNGEVIKSVLLTGWNLQTFRATREVAQRIDSESLVDLVTTTAIPIEGLKQDPHQASQTVYRIDANDVDPFGLISPRSNQTLHSITARSAEVTVYQIRPTSSLAKEIELDPPTDACRTASTVIQSDDPLIERLAIDLVGQSQQPVEIAAKLTRGVFERISKKNFSRAFASAREVAQALEGDCTEHSVLLVALLRNRGIPARIASGLVYTNSQPQPSMAYHMWVEAWLNQRWLPLDATTGGLIGTGHIKFLESPLDGGNPYVALLPVMTQFSNLKLQVLSSR